MKQIEWQVEWQVDGYASVNVNAEIGKNAIIG